MRFQNLNLYLLNISDLLFKSRSFLHLGHKASWQRISSNSLFHASCVKCFSASRNGPNKCQNLFRNLFITYLFISLGGSDRSKHDRFGYIEVLSDCIPLFELKTHKLVQTECMSLEEFSGTKR